jgi:hypothetical protein
MKSSKKICKHVFAPVGQSWCPKHEDVHTLTVCLFCAANGCDVMVSK